MSDPDRSNAAEQAADGTRRRLIAAALDIFGEHGFEGASTREIARRADANLAAIPYHFGGKMGLHRAVAEHIAESAEASLGPLVDITEGLIAEGAIGAADAHELLRRILDATCDLLLANPEAARWAPYIVREQMQPSDSFAALYDGFLGRAHRLITAVYGRATGRAADAPDTVVRVFMLFGQVLVFRAARATVERRLGWREYGEAEVETVRAALHANLDALIAADAAP